MCKLMKLYIMTLSHTNCHAIKLIDKPDIPTILVNFSKCNSNGESLWNSMPGSGTIKVQVNEN